MTVPDPIGQCEWPDVESHFGETGRKLGQKAFQKNCEIAGLDEARAALDKKGQDDG